MYDGASPSGHLDSESPEAASLCPPAGRTPAKTSAKQMDPARWMLTEGATLTSAKGQREFLGGALTSSGI